MTSASNESAASTPGERESHAISGIAPPTDAGRPVEIVEAELAALHGAFAAQHVQLKLATDRLLAFEDLVAAIQATRTYRVLRALGRWAGVERVAEYLLSTDNRTTPDAAVTDTRPRLVGSTHNIPSVLPADYDFVAGMRLENTGRTVVQLPAQHTAFWNTSVSGPHWTISVTVDGRFLLHAQIPDEHIDEGACVTVFFPLHTGTAGTHRVRLTLESSIRTDSRTERVLFDITYRSTRRARLGPLARLKTMTFAWRFGEWPRLFGVARCWSARRALRSASNAQDRRERLRHLKDENRRLAFLEKQMRRPRVRSLPCYLTVDSTVDCNLRCPLCFRDDATAALALPTISDMPAAVVDELIRTLLPTAITISPSGWGEPLLSPHLDRLLEACAEHGVFMSFTTNGVLLNRRGLLDKLIPVLHWLEISVDSVRAELFEQLRTGARFDQVMRNARQVGRLRASLPQPAFNYGFSMTLFRENLTELPAMLRLVADCGGNFLKTDIGVIFSRNNVHHSALGNPAVYNDTYDEAQRLASELGLRLFMRPPFTDRGPGEASRYGVCDSLYTHANISTDGSYKPCYSSILPSRAAAGGADLVRLWNSAEMRRLRRDHDTDRASSSCKTCYVTLRGRDSVANRTRRFIRLDEVEG